MDVRIGLTLAFVLLASTAWAKAPARTTTAGAAEHWSERSVHVTLDPSLNSLGPHALDDVRAGFGAWLSADVGLPHFVFDIGTVSGVVAKDGTPRVLATHDVAPGHEKDIAYTVSWADTSTGAIVESDIVFNLAYRFGADMTDSCSMRWDTRSVATHEIGHFLGLAEDMTDSAATMWFRTDPCDAHKAQLGSGDVAAIESLYAETVATPSASTCSIGSPNSPAYGAFWGLAPIVAVYMRRRSRSQRP